MFWFYKKILEIFWRAFVPIYKRYGARRITKKHDDLGFERVDTTASSTPHKAMKTKGTEYQWKWIELFSLFKITEYIPAINIEHWSERFGIFTIICLGEGVSIKLVIFLKREVWLKQFNLSNEIDIIYL